MTGKGGARPGAGRKRGSVTRRSAEVLDAALSEGLTPVEYMLGIMRDEKADPKMRTWAAEKAAPFCHPRPSPVSRTIEIDLPDISSVEGVTAALAAITKEVGSGNLAPADAQPLVAIIEAQRKAIETGEILERIERLEEARDQK